MKRSNVPQPTVVWMYDFFVRRPDLDLMPGRRGGGAAWRAFVYIDGGIWYAGDDEDYSLVAKRKCSACDGGRASRCPAPDNSRLRGVPSGCGRGRCPECGMGCTICDGRGYVFEPSKVRNG